MIKPTRRTFALGAAFAVTLGTIIASPLAWGHDPRAYWLWDVVITSRRRRQRLQLNTSRCDVDGGAFRW